MALFYADMPTPKYTDQAKDFVREIPHHAKNYVKNMFPIVHWLPKYNWIWFSGDLTAAITVGTLVIPQSLAYGTFYIYIYIIAGWSKD